MRKKLPIIAIVAISVTSIICLVPSGKFNKSMRFSTELDAGSLSIEIKGMNKQEVESKLGVPDFTQVFPPYEVWAYYIKTYDKIASCHNNIVNVCFTKDGRCYLVNFDGGY